MLGTSLLLRTCRGLLIFLGGLVVKLAVYLRDSIVFYVGTWAALIGGSCMIWPGTALSDHAPISLRIIAQRPDGPRRGCRIPDAILSIDSMHAQLQDIWTVSPCSPPADFASFLAERIVTSSEICRHHAIARRRHLRTCEQGLHLRLASIHRLQQVHAQDAFLAQEESQASAELSLILEKRAAFTYHASVSQWIAKADRMNGLFFSYFSRASFRLFFACCSPFGWDSLYSAT